jgi:phosphatidylglycerol:prolipoprotein diacylglycerol transferase
MYPVLIELGPLTVYSYGLMLAVGFLIAMAVAEKRGVRAGIDQGVMQTLAVVMLVSGLLGGRLAYVLLNLPVFLARPIEIFRLDHGGLVFYGGLILGAIVFFLFTRAKKLPFWGTLDVVVPALALAHAAGRVGCFLNGCCYGKPTQAPWGVLFPGDTVPRHPVQLYETAALILIYFVLKAIDDARFRTGTVTAVYGLLYGVWRFIAEFLRDDNPVFALGLTIFQWGSLLLIVISVCFLLRVLPRTSPPRTQ